MDDLVFFKKKYTLRRHSETVFVRGYASSPYEDMEVSMDIQTASRESMASADGKASLQKLKAFCDFPLLNGDDKTGQKADRVFFQGRWFECRSSRFSGNTVLKHYTAEFVELPDSEAPPASG